MPTAVDGDSPRNGAMFADLTPGSPDGIRCDERRQPLGGGSGGGDGFDGVHVFAPDGTRIGQILLPEQCANLTFGGRRRTRLFMTASQSVYSVYVRVRGLG